MRKLLRPGDILLFGLAGIVDIYEEIKDPFGIAALGAKSLYGWVPRRFKRHNLSRVVANRLRTGEVEKIIKDGEAYLRLTSAGKERIIRDFPMLSFAGKKWDGKWRVVIFDIAEINRYQRDRLRAKFKELGFGMLQESVWVTPHDVAAGMREYLEANGLGDYVYVMEVSGILAGSRDLLINKIWHLSDVSKQYREIFDEAKELREMYVAIHDRVRQHTYTDRDIRNMEKRIIEVRGKYLQVLLIDPHLPKELLPEDWAGERARKMINCLRP